MSIKPFRCEACGAVEHTDPRRICAGCHLEFVQLRNLAREMSRRFKFDYIDVHLAIRKGINLLVDKANEVIRRG
jgi:hypothetical protein